MSAIQKVFSRHEKIKGMLANLEEMKNKGEVAEEQYEEFKSKYNVLLDEAMRNLKEIRKALKEERTKAKTALDEITKEAQTVEVRGKTGELNPEQVSKTLTDLYSKRDDLESSLTRLESQLAARSSRDVGGAVEVDVNEHIDYRPESRLDWQNLQAFLGDVRNRVKSFKGSEMGQTLSSAAGHMRERAAGVQKQPMKKRTIIYASAALVVLIVLGIAWSLLFGGGDEIKLTERMVESAVRQHVENDTPHLELSVSSLYILKECAMAGLIMATDPDMHNFQVNTGMEHLVSGSGRHFTLNMAEPGDIEVVRFSPPAPAGGMTISLVEYKYNWQPTILMTNPEFKTLRETIRHQLVDVEKDMKIQVSRKITLGLFTDGWQVLED